MPDGEIAVDDPRSADISELLQRHLTFAHTHTPPTDVHALDIAGLLDRLGARRRRRGDAASAAPS